MLPASRDGTDSSGPPGSVSRYGGRDLTSDRPSGRPALFEPSARSRTGSSKLDSASSGVGSVRSHPGSASVPPYREAIHTRWVTSSRFRFATNEASEHCSEVSENPTFRRRRLRRLMRPDSRNRSHPLIAGTPTLSPVFLRRGSDPLALPPFALRAELIAHLFAKPSVSTLKRPSEPDPCSPIDEPASLFRGVPPRASAFRKPAVRVPRPFESVITVTLSSVQEKSDASMRFFIHSTPPASHRLSTIPHESRHFIHLLRAPDEWDDGRGRDRCASDNL